MISNFPDALNHLQCGQPIRRENWCRQLFVVNPNDGDLESLFVFNQESKMFKVWIPSAEEMFASNWELVDMPLRVLLDGSALSNQNQKETIL